MSTAEKKLEGGKDGSSTSEKGKGAAAGGSTVPGGTGDRKSAATASAAQGFHSWAPASPPPPAAGDGTTANWLMVTLGANFDISNIIPQKFNGTPGTFLEYFLRLQAADKQMAAYGFCHPSRFLEILKTLEGLPLKYVNSLPLTDEGSYVRAIDTLKKVYCVVQNPFRQAWKKSLNRPKCINTWESRSSFHAEMTALFNSIEQMDPYDVWREANFVILEEKMDEGLLREWAALTSKHRDENNCIGHTVTIEQMLDMVCQVMVRDLRIQQSGTTSALPPNSLPPHPLLSPVP